MESEGPSSYSKQPATFLILSQSISLGHILILSSHPHLSFPSGLLPSDIQPKPVRINDHILPHFTHIPSATTTVVRTIAMLSSTSVCFAKRTFWEKPLHQSCIGPRILSTYIHHSNYVPRPS